GRGATRPTTSPGQSRTSTTQPSRGLGTGVTRRNSRGYPKRRSARSSSTSSCSNLLSKSHLDEQLFRRESGAPARGDGRHADDEDVDDRGRGRHGPPLPQQRDGERVVREHRHRACGEAGGGELEPEAIEPPAGEETVLGRGPVEDRERRGCAGAAGFGDERPVPAHLRQQPGVRRAKYP